MLSFHDTEFVDPKVDLIFLLVARVQIPYKVDHVKLPVPKFPNNPYEEFVIRFRDGICVIDLQILALYLTIYAVERSFILLNIYIFGINIATQ